MVITIEFTPFTLQTAQFFPSKMVLKNCIRTLTQSFHSGYVLCNYASKTHFDLKPFNFYNQHFE